MPEYVRKFNYLAQYGTYHTDTDEKKRDCFLVGLNSKLREMLALYTSCTYNELVSAAIVQEDATCAHEDEVKRKRNKGSSSGSPPFKHRLVLTSLTG